MLNSECESRVGAVGAIAVLVGVIGLVSTALISIPIIQVNVAPYGGAIYRKFMDGFWIIPICGLVGIVSSLIAVIQKAKFWPWLLFGGALVLLCFGLLYVFVGPPR